MIDQLDTEHERSERRDAARHVPQRRQARAARRLQREIEQRQAEDDRMDELLDKIARYGKDALTDEEKRFMERVSARYRNR